MKTVSLQLCSNISGLLVNNTDLYNMYNRVVFLWICFRVQPVLSKWLFGTLVAKKLKSQLGRKATQPSKGHADLPWDLKILTMNLHYKLKGRESLVNDKSNLHYRKYRHQCFNLHQKLNIRKSYPLLHRFWPFICVTLIPWKGGHFINFLFILYQNSNILTVNIISLLGEWHCTASLAVTCIQILLILHWDVVSLLRVVILIRHPSCTQLTLCSRAKSWRCGQ